MDYTSLIMQNNHYKYSANVCFDLNDASRISAFIPNEVNTGILRDFASDIISGRTSNHSRILYGSYGTGKSHLLTVLGAILGHINTEGEEFDRFLTSIEKYDEDFAMDLMDFAKSRQRFLIVPIYTEHADFGKCIIYSLRKELEENGINVNFTGFYDEALSLLKLWVGGEESRTKLDDECGKLSTTIPELMQGLSLYDEKYGELFKSIYSGISYGAQFNSISGSLIGNLERANAAIKGKYDGIVFVFDEFGRYIEDNSDSIRIKDIQDMAEFCDHTGFNNYLILVSHKQLSLYAGVSNKELSDEWKKVEGRFKTTSINMRYDQSLSLISSIIPKSSDWESFRIRFEDELNDLYKQAWGFRGFKEIGYSSDNKLICMEEGYPLHPVTLYALERLSKRVAQNERTYFTFLVSNEEYSLFSTLKRYSTDEFHFVGLDDIYDYFEINIQTYKTNGAYDIYKKYRYAIEKLGMDNHCLPARVLRTMAVMFIVDDSSVIIPDRDTLKMVIDFDDEEISAAIDVLEERKIIRYMRQYGFYDFFDASIFDIDNMIAEQVSGINEEMVIAELNEEFSDFVIYPYEYNEYYHVNRVVLPVFARKEDLERRACYSFLPKYYDGIIFFVLESGRDLKDYYGISKEIRKSILHINCNANSLENEVRRYIAIKYYYTKKDELSEEDPTVSKELEFYLAEQRAIIDKIIDDWKNCVGKIYFTIMSGEARNVSSVMELSNFASLLMFTSYPHTIIVKNDIINKNVVSGAIKKARSKALASIINEEDIYAGCPPLSPENNIIRSVLTMNGLDEKEDLAGCHLNRLKDGSLSGKYVMKEVVRFVHKAEKGKYDLNKLYEKLKGEPYGLRDGYIPVLLAFALRGHKNISFYFHGEEKDYNEEVLVKALLSPKDYSVYICDLSEEQEKYIGNLEQLFAGDIVDSKGTNRLKKLYDAMNRHYASVSKCARTSTKYVSQDTVNYRNLLNVTHTDYNKFFFEELASIEDIQNLDIRIGTIKQELEDVPKRMINEAEKVIIDIFGLDKNMPMASQLKTMYESDWAGKSTKAFDYSTNLFLDYCKLLDNEGNDQIADKLAKIMTGFETEYWTDNKAYDFSDSLKAVLSKIEGYSPSDVLSEDEVKINIDFGNKPAITTRFTEEELSVHGTVMLNKLRKVVKNFGESLDYEEKLNVISMVLRDVIGQR